MWPSGRAWRDVCTQPGHERAFRRVVAQRIGHGAVGLAQDVRQAMHVLVKWPAFTFVGVTTLALCIAANVTLFGLVYSILLDEEGHWQSFASAMASVLKMEELS